MYEKFKLKIQVASFSPYLIKKRLGATEFDFLIGDPLGKDWYDRDSIGNTHEMCFIRDKMIEKGNVIFECGSHHGYTTLLLAQWVGEKGAVIAFEASRHNFDILQKNVEINKVTNILAYNAAVGNSEGEVVVSYDLNVNILKGRHGDVVKMVNLDKYKEKLPNLIKIDVEGFEVEVLKGCKEILRSKPKLVIEIHVEHLYKYGATVEEIFDLIGIDSYEMWIQWSPDEQPKRYNNQEILHSVHLFALPKI